MRTPGAQVVDLRPVPLLDVSKSEIIEAIVSSRPPMRSFVGVNAHSVFLAEHDATFREVLGRAYCFCDGFGVHLLARVQGLKRPRHRNTPTDFMWGTFARLAESGMTVYLLGDEPGVAEAFAREVEKRHPGLVSGHHHGFFAFGSAEEGKVIDEINGLRPHLLCVGMGQPRQEIWADERRNRLDCAATLHLGASMAFAVGARRRGPKWATDRGLEWAFRVLHEPRRMADRYFVEIPRLIARGWGYRRARR